ncbi:BMP family ABC transporter substrate-binding protein [Vibrio sinaloensis]|nr:BMP family ABC transporter substrate-binding protein [Vibrio sinaloensis]
MAFFGWQKKTQTNKVGFVGGMDIPVINQFLCGYHLGVMDSNPNTTVTAHYINRGAQSWQDTQAASVLSDQMIASGVDIIFPVAGYASLGVVESVKHSEKKGYSFGIDYDYSQRYPETTLASLEKKVDLAVYAALMQLKKNGIWNGSHKQFGVKQGVISIALNHSNTVLSEADRHAVKQLLLDLKGKSSQISQKDRSTLRDVNMKTLYSYVIKKNYLLLTTIPFVLFGSLSIAKDIYVQHNSESSQYHRVIAQQQNDAKKALINFDLLEAELVATRISQLDYIVSVTLDSYLYGMKMAEIINSESTKGQTLYYPVFLMTNPCK